MPKIISPQEFDSFVDIVSQPRLPTRTLQRRLKQLEEEGQISSTGRGKGKCYFPTRTHKKRRTKKKTKTTQPPKKKLKQKRQTLARKKKPALHQNKNSSSSSLPPTHTEDVDTEQLSECLRQIITERLDQSQAKRWVTFHALNQIQKDQQTLFINAVHHELESLHLGNIAKHEIKPTEFESWNQTW